MRKLLFIIGIIILISCGHISSDANHNLSNKENISKSSVTKNIDTIHSLLSENIEKVTIEYWDNYYANSYIFEINSNKKGTNVSYWGHPLFSEKSTLTELVAQNRLINYINMFYIDKKEDIILGTNENEPIITEKSSLSVTKFKKGKQVSKEYIKIESHIIYHPQFVEFYQFLDSIVKNH
ncbi:MAG: hypothetical protein GX163_11290 [Bacteroidetes bacterium]|jgi:hypothetical protein|nr:hypothetical protein [Bacteroidota bacterium]